jgi:WD40 repeat protein
MDITEQYGPSTSIVRLSCPHSGPSLNSARFLCSLAESRFLVSGSADNTMKLWEVQTGKCLFTWEFPTAVKRVAFSEDDGLIACITEQRMGYQGAVRIFEINRSGGEDERMC